MGLSIGEAHWTYSWFRKFRRRLADSIGINIRDMAGFGGEISWGTVHDDIVPLLDHSDCDGELSPDDCAKVAPRLSEVINPWPNDDWMREQRMILAAEMERHSASGEYLVFS